MKQRVDEPLHAVSFDSRQFITVLEGNLTNAKFMELDNRHLEGLRGVCHKSYFCR